MDFFSEIISRNTCIGLSLFGIAIFAFGFYCYKNSERNGWEDFLFFAKFFMLAGLFISFSSNIINTHFINYVVNNKNSLVSINFIDEDNNIIDTNSDRVVMKFKNPDNSIKNIRASIKEKYTKDKKKYNKYSLENIEDGYVIYYISKDTDPSSKPTLKYVDKVKASKNNTEKDTDFENTRHRTLKVLNFGGYQTHVYF